MKINRILVDSGTSRRRCPRVEKARTVRCHADEGLRRPRKNTRRLLCAGQIGREERPRWFVKPKPDVKSILYVQANVNAWKTTLHAGFLSAAVLEMSLCGTTVLNDTACSPSTVATKT